MRRRIWWIVGGGLALLVLAAVVVPMIYAASEEDAPPARTVEAQPEGVELAAETDGTWTVGTGSSAGYRVDEVLNGVDVTVAGTTEQVTGQVVVEGGDLTSAEVVVDVAAVTTDSSRRDGYFRENVMEAGTHPTATFVVIGPVDLPELTGTPVTVPVTGELTIKGTAREVLAELSVVRTPDGVDVSGSVPLVFADHGVEAPDLGFVRVEDRGAVEFLLRLAR